MNIIDHIHIAEGFQSSVNIDFDLTNGQKLLEYVPTSDVCDVFESYIDAFTSNKNQSSFLVGPYGKGKSFLTLALLQVACGIADKEALDLFIHRVSAVNQRLAEKLRKFTAAKKRFIPIVVNSDYDNLKQSFMVALRNGLSAAGLDNLVPESSYDECRKILSAWQKDPTTAQGRLSACSKTCDLAMLDKGLSNYSPTAYADFVRLYDCVTIGQRFNPLVNEDVPRLFAEVSAEVKKKGYSGLIVVFDEFSKFLESKSKRLGDDLKFIQDFAEKACRSDNHYSLYLCCIAHKPISQYSEKNSKINDLLKTVDGRFVTLRFHRGMRENMELISNVIVKNAGFSDFFHQYVSDNQWLFDGVDSLKLLDSTDDFMQFAYGCYPLNPLAAYCLVRVSELVAQNERTLFTFLSGNDSTGMRRYLMGDDKNLIATQAVYDYFSDLFTNEQDQRIRDVCYLVDSIASKEKDENKLAIVKSLAVIKILDDYRALRPTYRTIACATGIDEAKVRGLVREMEQNGVLRVGLRDETIDFSFVGSKEINDKAEVMLSKELRKIKPLDYLNDLESDQYLTPNAYNAVHRIVRFAKYWYVDYETFLTLPSFKQLGKLPYDALVLRIEGDNIDSERVANKLKEIGDEKVIAQLPRPHSHESLYKLLKYYAAYKKMIDVSNQRVIEDAVPFVLNECKEEIKNLISDAYDGSEAVYLHCKILETKPAVFINKVFESLYPQSPYVNNEMLNRNIITAQYRKARNDVVDFLLEHGADQNKWKNAYSETSAQNTIWRVFVDCIDDPNTFIRPVVEVIKARLGDGSDRVLIKDITDDLTKEPYGIRAGVVPLFYAIGISEFNRIADSSVILYFRQREIELNAQNLDKACQDVGENYRLAIRAGARQRGEYLALLIELFSNGAKKVGNAQLALALCKAWYGNLPQVVRTGTVEEYPNSFSREEETLLKELSKYDINPTDFLFDFLPKTFGGKTLKETVRNIGTVVESLKEKESTILEKEFGGLSGMLGFPHGSLLSGFKNYLKSKDYKMGDLIGNSQYIDFAELITKSSSHDDATFINEASGALLGQSFESWDRGSKKLFITRLVGWKDYVESSYADDRREELKRVGEMIQSQGNLEYSSPLAHLLESRIRDAIKQFGASVTEEDVTTVLTRILSNRGERQ